MRRYLAAPSPFVPPEPPFREASACIRLGHKYQVDGLVKEGLAFLRKLYPSDFITLQIRRRDEILDNVCAISVVNIARLTGADYLLPVALAACCQLGSDILEGYTREDGTREFLSSADLGRCFQGKENLIEARVQATLEIFNGQPAEECLNPDKDARTLQNIQAGLPKRIYGRLCSADVFQKWWPDALDHTLPDLCRECSRMITRTETSRQRAIFARLPSLVGVEVKRWRKGLLL